MSFSRLSSCPCALAWALVPMAWLHLAAAEARPAAQAPCIEVRPRTVYAGSLCQLRAGPAGAALSCRWSAAAGLLHFDDLPVVDWRAPAKPGVYTVSLSCTVTGAPAHVETSIAVVAPSTDGMARVPAGTFRQGDVTGTSNINELKTLQNASDEPSHVTYLDAYWIDRRLITNRQYVAFLEECLAQGSARITGVAVFGDFEGASVPFYYFEPYTRLIPHYYQTRNARQPELLRVITWDGSKLRIKEGRDEHPVVDVSWFGAAAYASFHGKELPTEAQWEKAARGAHDARRYPWGDHLPGPYLVGMNAYRSRELEPVGSYSPLGDSPFGMADAISGCFEWTRDWFHPTVYADYASETPLRNPRGPFWGRAHAIRGLPYGVDYPQSAMDDTEPLSFRYSWDFEFLIGDTFANRSTGFRTVLPAP